MAIGDRTTTKELIKRLKNRLDEQSVKLAVLDPPSGRITRALNRLLDEGLGAVSPTTNSLKSIATAVWRWMQEESSSNESKQRDTAQRFWERFCADLAELHDTDLPPIKSAEALNDIFSAIVFKKGAYEPTNPFTWRDAIDDPGAFFGRVNQLRRIHDFIHTRSNVHIVGPRRIGKSSLLLAVAHRVDNWLRRPALALLDMQKANCQTLAGWLRCVARDWNWPEPPCDLATFSENVEVDLRSGRRLILCMDEFEKFAHLTAAFTQGFFENLRACGQQGMSMVTVAHMPLHEIREAGALLSPYYNTFADLHLGNFTEEESKAFVSLPRPCVPRFSANESEEILRFAAGHPLKLQIACLYVVEARLTVGSLPAAMQMADREAEHLLPPSSRLLPP
ncbi:MAG: nSTAND1 domain-containing NTPase [Limisphaerales bacterium]